MRRLRRRGLKALMRAKRGVGALRTGGWRKLVGADTVRRACTKCLALQVRWVGAQGLGTELDDEQRVGRYGHVAYQGHGTSICCDAKQLFVQQLRQQQQQQQQ